VTREQGPLEEAIVDVARAHKACLVVMPTRGHDGLGDALLGSHTERVIREVGCPVLSVPI
jgi:nucleotide-binding universal stress UspA family protein